MYYILFFTSTLIKMMMIKYHIESQKLSIDCFDDLFSVSFCSPQMLWFC